MRPLMFVFSTRACAGCVGRAVEAVIDAVRTAIAFSIDGAGASDHVLRSSMFSKKHELFGAALLSRTYG